MKPSGGRGPRRHASIRLVRRPSPPEYGQIERLGRIDRRRRGSGLQQRAALPRRGHRPSGPNPDRRRGARRLVLAGRASRARRSTRPSGQRRRPTAPARASTSRTPARYLADHVARAHEPLRARPPSLRSDSRATALFRSTATRTAPAARAPCARPSRLGSPVGPGAFRDPPVAKGANRSDALEITLCPPPACPPPPTPLGGPHPSIPWQALAPSAEFFGVSCDARRRRGALG